MKLRNAELECENAALRKDKERLDWFFGANAKTDFLPTYFEGINNLWTADQWRWAIDKAMKAGG